MFLLCRPAYVFWQIYYFIMLLLINKLIFLCIYLNPYLCFNQNKVSVLILFKSNFIMFSVLITVDFSQKWLYRLVPNHHYFYKITN